MRVMASGQEIDRVTRLQQLSGGVPTIVYRRRTWPVTDGCIHVEDGDGLPAASPDSPPDAWIQLVAQLLAAPLPTRLGECTELLRAVFRKSLPDGIVLAVSTLASLDREAEARELLVDFLDEKHDSERLRKLVQLQLLFIKRTVSLPASPASEPPAECPGSADLAAEGDFDGDDQLHLTWLPAGETQAPAVDDSALRNAARGIQDSIGAHHMQKAGAVVVGLGEMPDEQDWELSPASEPAERPVTSQDNILVQRTSSLGSIALDVLRYFADNPGDRASHAEQVLGYPRPVINGLLSGTLSQYLQRNGSGGWACQTWVPDVLAALDSTP